MSSNSSKVVVLGLDRATTISCSTGSPTIWGTWAARQEGVRGRLTSAIPAMTVPAWDCPGLPVSQEMIGGPLL